MKYIWPELLNYFHKRAFYFRIISLAIPRNLNLDFPMHFLIEKSGVDPRVLALRLLKTLLILTKRPKIGKKLARPKSFTRFLKIADQLLYSFLNNCNFVTDDSMQIQKWVSNSFFNKISSCDLFLIKLYQ